MALEFSHYEGVSAAELSANPNDVYRVIKAVADLYHPRWDGVASATIAWQHNENTLTVGDIRIARKLLGRQI